MFIIVIAIIFAILAFVWAFLGFKRTGKTKEKIIDEVEECTDAAEECTDAAEECTGAAEECNDAIYNNTYLQELRFAQLQNCSCQCTRITQATLGAGSVTFTASGCYELGENIVYGGTGTAIIFDRCTGTLGSNGHNITLTNRLGRAIALSNGAHFIIDDQFVIKPNTSTGISVLLNRNCTATIRNLRNIGTGIGVGLNPRSTAVIRNMIHDARFDPSQWPGPTTVTTAILALDDAMLDVDGLQVRVVDVSNEQHRAPNYAAQFYSRGVYIGFTSGEPKYFQNEPGNSTHSILHNVNIRGATQALSIPHFDTLDISNVVVDCADSLYSTCVLVGNTEASFVRTGTIDGLTVHTGNLRPQAYQSGNNSFFWQQPVLFYGVQSLQVNRLNVDGVGGMFYDPDGIQLGLPLFKRFPLVMIDAAPFAFPANGVTRSFPSKNVVITNSVITATDNNTVGMIIGMGSGVMTGDVSATLDHVKFNNGSIGLLVGPRAQATQLDHISIENSYYGIILANGTKGTILQDAKIQRTCRPYWVQESAKFNLLQRVEATVNGEVGLIDNPNPLDNETPSVNDRFVQNNCWTEPRLPEKEIDWDQYNNFVGFASVEADYLLPTLFGQLYEEEM
jgi:hypothetical protein